VRAMKIKLFIIGYGNCWLVR